MLHLLFNLHCFELPPIFTLLNAAHIFAVCLLFLLFKKQCHVHARLEIPTGFKKISNFCHHFPSAGIPDMCRHAVYVLLGLCATHASYQLSYTPQSGHAFLLKAKLSSQSLLHSVPLSHQSKLMFLLPFYFPLVTDEMTILPPSSKIFTFLLRQNTHTGVEGHTSPECSSQSKNTHIPRSGSKQTGTSHHINLSSTIRPPGRD